MKVFLGSDHAGLPLKNKIRDVLLSKDYVLEDMGCFSENSCDYPLFGAQVARKVVKDPQSLGIVICGSGLGIGMAAGKIRGARVAHANSIELAQLGRSHNGANILALGSRTQFIDDPIQIVKIFLSTPVNMDDRHVRRRHQLDSL